MHLCESVHSRVEIPGGQVVAPLTNCAELRLVDDVCEVCADEAGEIAGELHQVHVRAHLRSEIKKGREGEINQGREGEMFLNQYGLRTIWLIGW